MILKPIDIDLFCKGDSSNIFRSKNWLSIYPKEQLQLIGIYKDDHQFIGGFYFLKTKKYGLSFIKLPPYTPHCNLFYSSENKTASSINNFSKELMTNVANYLIAQKNAITILAFPYTQIDFQPFIWNKFKVIPNYTYHINLNKSIEDIVANFDPKNRNTINKANKEGLEISENNLTKEELFNFFLDSLTQAGANVYENELKNIFYNFSNTSNSFSFSAKNNNDLLGTVFCVYDANTCYYLLGGAKKNSGVQGVNNLLIQKSIEKAKQLGCSTFDFEGSMLKGVEKFFRGFGPELVPYFTINKALLPIELLLKFKNRSRF